MRKTGIFNIALFIALAPSLFAGLELDKAHTRMGFIAKYMMITDVRGQFDDYDIKLSWDEKDPSKSTVEVVIKTSSINTQHSKRDNHLKSPDFFDVEKFPEIRFMSKKIEKKEGGFTVTGDLTMRDVTKEMSISVSQPLSGQDPFGNAKLVFSAESKLNRKDYNINWNKALDAGGVLVGDEISLEFSLVFNKK